MGSLIIDGNAVYEIDEECMRRKGQNGALGKPGQGGRISAVKEDTRVADGGTVRESNRGNRQSE